MCEDELVMFLWDTYANGIELGPGSSGIKQTSQPNSLSNRRIGSESFIIASRTIALLIGTPLSSRYLLMVKWLFSSANSSPDCKSPGRKDNPSIYSSKVLWSFAAQASSIGVWKRKRSGVTVAMLRLVKDIILRNVRKAHVGESTLIVAHKGCLMATQTCKGTSALRFKNVHLNLIRLAGNERQDTLLYVV